MVFTSRKPEAERFADWIASEVLPRIRKHGMYAKDELLDNPDLLIEVATKIEKARSLPQELLKTASLPVEGLEVDEQGRIRINGTLLDGLSDGEKIDFAFRLAKAQAGELKVICIDGWQNLGSKAQEILKETAARRSISVFIEEVELELMEIAEKETKEQSSINN